MSRAAEIDEKIFQALLSLARQSPEFQSETVRKALALYLKAMSDPNNRVLIVNDVNRTTQEIHFI